MSFKVGQKVVYPNHGVTIVEDIASPAGGFTTSDYDAIAAEFDNFIFPSDTAWFGKPSDINRAPRLA